MGPYGLLCSSLSGLLETLLASERKSELFLPFPFPLLSSGISFGRVVSRGSSFIESSLLFRVLKKDFLDGGSWRSQASPWDSCSLAIPNALAFLAVGQYIEFNLPSS